VPPQDDRDQQLHQQREQQRDAVVRAINDAFRDHAIVNQFATSLNAFDRQYLRALKIAWYR